MYEKVWSSVEYLRLFIFLALFATSSNNPSTNYLLKFNYRLFLYLLNNSHEVIFNQNISIYFFMCLSAR